MHDRVGEVFSGIRKNRVHAMLQPDAFSTNGGGDNGFSQRHCFQHFQTSPAACPQRDDVNRRLLHGRAYIGHEPGKPYLRFHRRGNLETVGFADQNESGIGSLGEDSGKHIGEKPLHSIAIREPAHLADEHQLRGFARFSASRAVGFEIDAIRHDMHRGFRCQQPQLFRIGCRTGEHGIGAAAGVALEIAQAW